MMKNMSPKLRISLKLMASGALIIVILVFSRTEVDFVYTAF